MSSCQSINVWHQSDCGSSMRRLCTLSLLTREYSTLSTSSKCVVASSRKWSSGISFLRWLGFLAGWAATSTLMTGARLLSSACRRASCLLAEIDAWDTVVAVWCLAACVCSLTLHESASLGTVSAIARGAASITGILTAAAPCLLSFSMAMSVRFDSSAWKRVWTGHWLIRCCGLSQLVQSFVALAGLSGIS